MRFNSSIKNISVFSKFTASLVSIGPVAWLRLDNDQVRFTIIPKQGTQVWSVLSIDSVFRTYNIQSAASNNTINLEVPVEQLNRALRSAYGASSASLRLTQKDSVPLLALTIVRNTISNAPPTGAGEGVYHSSDGPDTASRQASVTLGACRDLETIVTQNVPVRVLSQAHVEGIHEPRCRDPDVHIMLPSLVQIKSISDRFTRIASGGRSSTTGLTTSLAGLGPRLELSANMHGSLRLRITTDALSISSLWTDLTNPDLDPTLVEGGEEGIRNHPSTRMRQMVDGGDDGTEAGWATVRIDGRDWSKVLSVSRLGGRVIACFIHEQVLILYVYLSTSESDDTEESVLTYYVTSYSA